MTKKEPVKHRNLVAVASYLRGGAGKHADRRTRRLRDRGAQRRRAVSEQRQDAV